MSSCTAAVWTTLWRSRSTPRNPLPGGGFDKQAVVATVVEIALHRRKRRKVLRQHPPLAAGPPKYEIVSSTLATRSRAAGPDAEPPTYAAQSAPIRHPSDRLALRFARISPRAISIHILCLDGSFATTIIPQPTEITQFIFRAASQRDQVV